MDATAEIIRRLDAQDRLLHAIVAALAPPESETEGGGFANLIEVLSDLTCAVSDTAVAVQALRSDVSGRSRPAGAPLSAGA